MLELLIGNFYVVFEDKVFQKSVRILIYIINVFVLDDQFYDANFLQRLIRKNINSLGDTVVLNNIHFPSYVHSRKRQKQRTL